MGLDIGQVRSLPTSVRWGCSGLLWPRFPRRLVWTRVGSVLLTKRHSRLYAPRRRLSPRPRQFPQRLCAGTPQHTPFHIPPISCAHRIHESTFPSGRLQTVGRAEV